MLKPRQWEQPNSNTRLGRQLCQFIDDKPLTWGKGTRLSKDNPFPDRGMTALLIACVMKDRVAGRKVDERITAYVNRLLDRKESDVYEN